MTVNKAKTTAGFQISDEGFEHVVFNPYFAAAIMANQVMVIISGDLVDKMSTADMSGAHQSVIR